jgi:3-hydroxymyristoyl/3-hydroxydecanoyl-(acyl carrier protein) dehydratase
MLYLGLHLRLRTASFQPIPDRPQRVRCRGQVTPRHASLRYRLEIVEIGLEPTPFARANVDVLVDDTVIIRFEDLGLQLEGAGLVATEREIAEFATGSVAACFGPDYAIYDDRRTPRTPNGALQLLSRIVALDGERRDPRPGASLVSEYDVPRDAWFYAHNEVPYSILMEMALQPCGFLSASLGTTLGAPDADFYFRNLDGHGTSHRALDLRGRTVTDRVRLLSSMGLDGVIIQRFAFELACDETPFYSGEAAFGYFTRDALAQRTGLDSGAETLPWQDAARATGISLDVESGLLDRVVVVDGGGSHRLGYAYAERRVRADDWFFACHFYQDPVMPGSLGVEAMLEALQVYATHIGLGTRFCRVAQQTTTWKYRGQILPDSPWMRLEVHVTGIERAPDGGITISASGEVWRDRLRIYHVDGLGLRCAASGAGAW